jgi:hypothetical protein
VELLEHLPAAAVPSVRVLQRAFQRAGVNRPRRSHRHPTVSIVASAAHELWQVDAVEKARLRNGAEVSWLAASDVFSGAMLAAELSPPSSMAERHDARRPRVVSPRIHALGAARSYPGR